MKVLVAAALLLFEVYAVCVQVFMHTSLCVCWVHCLGTLTQMQEKVILFLHLSLSNYFFFEQVSLTECEAFQLAGPAGQ